ncbi:unnamed protein product [Notodromas monacha]|uniref:Rhodanese domain-containing protein n=1 Tax=Notodromas monacha TaxID=399045 RepID=A0A7R9BE75_9CRUS|nr:unnamed protein product [Notodromas monacha]CAG0913752.1 unnamed protein product [Notodromas monacha]
MGCCPVFGSRSRSLSIEGTPPAGEKVKSSSTKTEPANNFRKGPTASPANEHREVDLTFGQLKQVVLANPDSYVIIDVRKPTEVEERGRLPRAVNLPLGEIEEAMQLSTEDFEKKYHFPKVACNNDGIILYCCRGYRATEAKDKFKKLGIKCVQVYSGYLDYVENGGFVDRSKEADSRQS